MQEHAVFWVTGASSGIGEALSRALVARGARVAMTARSREALARLEAELGPAAQAFPGDVCDSAAMAALVRSIEAAMGPISCAILNAGIYVPIDGARPDLAAMHAMVDVNLKGSMNTLVPVIDAMKPRGQGTIALVASVAGYGGLPQAAGYGATKSALITMAEALSFDLAPLGIAMKVINLGFVATPATSTNAFEMPFLMQPHEAARRILDGLERDGFEIAFPRRFALVLKALRLLPYRLWFATIARATGWQGGRPDRP